MNRKIFTLLACTLMLFSTAFYANARSVAERSIGSVVKTLPGSGPGMYHIQIDSICVVDTVASGSGSGSGKALIWVPVTYDGNPNNSNRSYFQYNPGTKGYEFVPNASTSNTPNDTMILSVTEAGTVKMISASDLREKLIGDGAGLLDLQATMWCVNVVDPAASNFGQWPTFRFTNKIYDQDLDWKTVGNTILDGEDKGWMYSPSYKNGSLKEKMAFHRAIENDKAQYRVIVAELNNRRPTGILRTQNVRIDDYVAGKVEGMLKFSIVKISPFVLTAEEFNERLKKTEEGKLYFSKSTSEPNYFEYKLQAEESANSAAKELGYLNLKVYDDDENKSDEENYLGYIKNGKGAYYNTIGDKYLQIDTSTANVGRDDGDNNHSYRFVYFPSEDSLVINAYRVIHENHSVFGSHVYYDSGQYSQDGVGTPSFYYGLYTDTIHDVLTVRHQDLSTLDDASVMTIAHHTENVRISFGVDGCAETLFDAWQVPEGVYTIWDDRNRCLGVRIYNGSYSPQWMELAEGECPDRIPSYQWVVQKSSKSRTRVDIYNREFGNLSTISKLVYMENVLVRRGKSQIFKNNGQFIYDPIVLGYNAGMKYEPINYGMVEGILLDHIDADVCNVTATKSKSGFRPVTAEYTEDPYLGYKHFMVESNPAKIGFGKSEDFGDTKGMDYNAFAFNYLHYLGEDGYINMTSRFNDSLLYIKEEKLGFQFMLGSGFTETNYYKEESYGYPRTDWTNREIKDTYKDYPNSTYSYTQKRISALKRYYYRLKVADFYDFRNGLAEQYVVLKGAKEDGSDRQNALRYGVADVFAEKEPFKFANVYLRESYFLERPKELNEERHEKDDKHRIFYALLDRIEPEQLKTVTSLQGFEVSDTLMGDDISSKYNLVMVKVDEGIPDFLKAQGKTVSSGRASTFSLSNINYQLYRRLHSIEDDGAKFKGEDKNPVDLDAPKTLRIYRQNNLSEFLHEDVLSDKAFNYGINFLGLSNAVVNQENDEAKGADGMFKYNYHLFIDTAFINRGTGPIKPQYLIAVGQEEVKEGVSITNGFDPCGDRLDPIEIMPYVIGRYLINATDSARVLKSDGTNSVPHRDPRYIFDTSWDRLAFVPAIHVDDRLYLISEMLKLGVTEDDYLVYNEDDGKTYVNGAKLRKMTEVETINGKPVPGKLYGYERVPDNSGMYGAYYDFGTWNNYHNDVSFSLRFAHPSAKNANAIGEGGSSNYGKRFYIESETTKRTVPGSRKIAPVQGGWIRINNYVPVLSRSSYEHAIGNAEVFNVEQPTSWQGGIATPNETLTGNVAVVAGIGEVVILNAAGKKVSISNLLGQSLVNKELKSNNETISIAKGVVVVNVEGEAIKAIVK